MIVASEFDLRIGELIVLIALFFVLDAGASIELKVGGLSNGVADWSIPVVPGV